MKIAVGTKRTAKKWINKDISWEEFSWRCRNTRRTLETLEEYKKMTKAEQDEIKDVGGFVAGELKGGMRRNGYVNLRSALTLDLDHAVPDIWDAVTMLEDFRCLMYSTHKYTEKEPRVRLVVPFNRDVTADEYPAISRMIAKDIGIDMVDDTCHEPARLMYWPSTSSDGVFLFEEQDGPLLDPDEVLARYSDWRDTSLWPVSSRQSEIVKRSLEKQADPLEKPGLVGAFCRAYSITEAIDTFISDIYRPSHMEGRYDYLPADSSAGVVIYDDKFCYSFHASDPACGQLMNAFDVVRVHKFGTLDDKARPDTEPGKLPSYKAMSETAINDNKVKHQLARERMMKARSDFEEISEDDEWQEKLALNKQGGVLPTLTNFMEILRHDPCLSKICYNEHKCGIDVRDAKELPWKQVKPGWGDSDTASLAGYLDKTYNLFSPAKEKQALLTVAAERSFHPIKEYLSGLPKWDGIKRVDTLLIDYMGAEDDEYTRAVTRKTLAAAVSRVFHPGIKFDYVLVLVGDQGIGKSTFFARLGGEWFSDSLTMNDMRDKTGAEKLQGYWILELSELNGIRKMEVETVKSFISRVDDKYRAAYGTCVEAHPRQCIVVGTSNKNGFLRDITGNRRFWPVEVSADRRKNPWDLNKDTVDQIWAEALEIYMNGESLVLTGCAADYAVRKQHLALEEDDREGLIREYLDTDIPDNWRTMDLGARRMFLAGDELSERQDNLKSRELVCTLELWAECFGRDPSSLQKSDAYMLNTIMGRIEGWEKYTGNKSGRVRFPIYGPQNAYQRKKE